MSLWEDSKLKNAQALIEALLSDHIGSLGFRRLGRIEYDIAFAELLASSKNGAMSDHITIHTLQEMRKEGKISIDDFEVIYEQELEKINLKSSSNSDIWKFFYPVEVTLASDIDYVPKLQILGKTFSFISWKSVEKQVDKETRRHLRNLDDLTELTFRRMHRVPVTYLTARSKGPNEYVAWRKIDPAFEALRGVIEFSLNAYYSRTIWIGPPSALSKIPHPLWMLAYNKNVPPEWVPFVVDTDYGTEFYGFNNNTFNLTDAVFKSIERNVGLLRKTTAPNSILDLIADCFRLYVQAMDARFEYQRFLSLWQLAEAITHSDSTGGKTDEVAKRLAWHGQKAKLAGSGYVETLRAFGKVRNDIVHKGIHDVQENDTNILKYVCETALLWLISVHKSLPTIAHLDQFYQLRTLNKADLKARVDTIGYVKKLRS